MRIVIGTTTAFHLRYTAVELLRHGHDVTFFSYLPLWKTQSYGIPAASTRSLFWKLQPHAGAAVLRVGGRWVQRSRNKLLETTDLAIADALPPCDVYIGLSSMAVRSARVARERYGARVLIERGSSHILRQLSVARAGSAEEPGSAYVERELASYEQADRIVLLSGFAARTFMEEGVRPERLETMMLGVDVDRFRLTDSPPPLPVRAIFVGNWSRRKGADLITAMLERRPELELTHVGLPSDVPLPASTRFRSLGYCDHRQLSEILPQHHLLVFPSRDDGFGMVMAEALASGLRVAASDASGGPDLAAVMAPGDVEVFPAGSLDGLVAALDAQVARITANPLGFRPSRDAVAALSWRGYGRRYDSFLSRLERAG